MGSLLLPQLACRDDPPSPTSVMDELPDSAEKLADVVKDEKIDEPFSSMSPPGGVSSWLPDSFQLCGIGEGIGIASKYVADEDIPLEKGLGVEVGMLGVDPCEDLSDAPTTEYCHTPQIPSEDFKTPPRTKQQFNDAYVGVPCSPCSPSSARGKPMTASEAYEKGKMLEFICSGSLILRPSQLFTCNWGCTMNNPDDYESNWKGHQPLTPDTWSTTTYKFEDSNHMTASELRLNRRRRHRGLLTPPRQRPKDIMSNTHSPSAVSSLGVSGAGGGQADQKMSPRSKSKHSESIKKPSAWSISFPEDVEVPCQSDSTKRLHNLNAPPRVKFASSLRGSS